MLCMILIDGDVFLSTKCYQIYSWNTHACTIATMHVCDSHMIRTHCHDITDGLKLLDYRLSARLQQMVAT